MGLILKHILVLLSFSALSISLVVNCDPLEAQIATHKQPIANFSLLKTPFHSTVYLYNRINANNVTSDLQSTFYATQGDDTHAMLNFPQSWPNNGDTITALGHDQITPIAAFSRYTGISTGSKYTFSETITLPGIIEPIKLKQQITGTRFGTKAWIGIQLPDGREELFSDYQWHQENILHIDCNGSLLGTYTISYCFYHWYGTPAKVEHGWRSFLPSANAVEKTLSYIMTTALASLVVKGISDNIVQNINKDSIILQKERAENLKSSEYHNAQSATTEQQRLIQSLSNENLKVLFTQLPSNIQNDISLDAKMRIVDDLAERQTSKSINSVEACKRAINNGTPLTIALEFIGTIEATSPGKHAASPGVIGEALLNQKIPDIMRSELLNNQLKLDPSAFDFIKQMNDLNVQKNSDILTTRYYRKLILHLMSLAAIAAAAYYAPTIHANIVYQIEYTKAVPVP